MPKDKKDKKSKKRRLLDVEDVVDEKPRKKKRPKPKLKKPVAQEEVLSTSERMRRIQIMSRESPYTGVRFPNGTKAQVFKVYVRNDGVLYKTRQELKKTKILQDGRVPTLATLRHWEHEGDWEVLKRLVSDGLLDILNSSEDPNIKEAINDDATYFRVLLHLRSAAIVGMNKKNSPLWPKNAKDAVTLLRFLRDEITSYNERMEGARTRRGKPSTDTSDDFDHPGASKVIDIARERERRGETVDASSIAMDLIKRQNSN